ncbi:MAG: hypothetical protein WBX17_05030 [Microbacterium sp.]
MTTRQNPRVRATAVAALVALFAALAPAASAAAAPTDCATLQPGGPVQVTADCIDPTYAQPIIDAVTEEPSPVVHRRVAGHFENTQIRFNIYLPPANQWQGRFFQYTYPLTDANATDRAIGFGAASGGYTVQAGSSTGNSLGYRHAAAAAKFAATVAAEYYGVTPQDITGYLYGASGGSFQTIGAAENTRGVWDGYVPMVIGVPMSTPNNFFARAMARLILQDKAAQISDAVLPGGSGDPYAGLDEAETAMLRELTALGVPLAGWADPDYLLGLSAPDGLLGFGNLVRALDSTYAEDFWSKPGYLGTEQSPLGDRVRAALANGGDRWDIALRSYYRHQLPAAADGYDAYAQFRDAQGAPLYPQRALLLGPLVTRSTAGNASYSGDIGGKMIVVDNLQDVDAYPWHADWYAKRVKNSLGAAFDDNFRLYYNQNADHLEGDVTAARASRVVNYWGIVEQALRDVARWVEDGRAAPGSTAYEVQNGQVVVPENIAQRRGIQPSVDLLGTHGDVITARAGEPVKLRAKLKAAPGLGKLVAVEWDFEGTGEYVPGEFAPAAPSAAAAVTSTHVFTAPGTYFVSVKVTGQRDGDAASPYARVENLDRIRVVVTP